MSEAKKKLREIEQEQLRPHPLPHFKAGDTVRVSYIIKDGDKQRIQVFEGIVISRHRDGLKSTFTVRKISYGVGVERIFPVHSPHIERLEVKARGRVRQARLYYLRERSGKSARIREIGVN